jgi:serine O-acetyltransferase
MKDDLRDTGMLWVEVGRHAHDTAAREPFLRPLLNETVLSHATPEKIVGAVLARRLGDGSLRALIIDTLRGDPDVLAGVEADLSAVTARDPACRSPLQALLHFKGFQALQLHRVAHSLWRRGREEVAYWLSGQVSMVLAVDIHPAVLVGRGVVFDHATGIVIGETAVVEDEVTILHGVTLGATGKHGGDRHPKVRRGALLGAGASVIGNIEVGRMSKVGAGSVVLDDVPPHCTVAGVPAVVVHAASPRPLAAVPARFA